MKRKKNNALLQYGRYFTVCRGQLLKNSCLNKYSLVWLEANNIAKLNCIAN